jgi:nicotine blue oxidoreductase
MGQPKALVPGWLAGSVRALRDGGCDQVTVVLGAAADEARALLDPAERVVVAADWESGMGASLRVGLSALPGADAALVHLVDLPDVGAEVIARVGALAAPAALARASYGGVPGHPVLLGRDHWAGVAKTAEGDQGARAYLRGREVTLVECGDLATGRDVDSLS